MFIILVIVKVATVLPYGWVDPQGARIYFLGPQAVRFQLTVDIPFFLAVFILNPDFLNIRALDDMIPGAIGSPGVFLRKREEISLVHGLWVHQGGLLPNEPSLTA